MRRLPRVGTKRTWTWKPQEIDTLSLLASNVGEKNPTTKDRADQVHQDDI
jgi:hypothetical protein